MMKIANGIRLLARRLIKILPLSAISFFCGIIVTPVFGGITAVVPTDYATIQDAIEAVQNNYDPGEVIINDNGPFSERIYISQSVTVRAGTGFSPVIVPFSSYHPPIGIRAVYPTDTDTSINLLGLTIEMTGSTTNPAAMTITNDNGCDPLNVTIDNMTIIGTALHNAISIASAGVNDDISFFFTNSLIELEGSPAGSPSCIRLEPHGYNLSSTLRNNIFRFLNASAISISGGRDDKSTYTVIDGNVFTGLTGGWTRAITIKGGGTTGSQDSPTTTTITNNLFMRSGYAVEADTQPSHEHTVFFNNNTVVDCGVDSGSCDPSGAIHLTSWGHCAAIVATITNNIIVGSKGHGVKVVDAYNDPVGFTVNNDYNLFFDNAEANYYGPTPGDNDLITDPLFINPSEDNYRLSHESLAVDSGLNTPAGGSGFGEDLDKRPRIIDGNNDTVETIDRGAYEYLGEIYGCIFLRGEPLVGTTVELVQKDEPKQITQTNFDGCYQFGQLVSGKKFDLKIKGPEAP
jgi:hypothetical protein